MADLLRGRPQGERFSISAGWNTHFKQFDRKHLRGFKRPGTLCFRNVAILLLLHTSSIFNWLHVHMEWHNPDCPTPQECVLCLLYELFEAYWSEDRARKGHERWIFALWEIVVRYFPDFKNGQHDASEFLETMLKMLYGSTDKQHHADLDHISKVINVTYDVCQQCKCVGNLGGTTYLALPGSFADNKTSITVEDAIRNNLNNSQMQVTCTNCNARTALRCEQIASPPENLFVQIHRADTHKIQTQVQFENKLTIPSELKFGRSLKKSTVQYELYAVIFHHGSLTSEGHYSIAVKGPNREWLQIDDTHMMSLQVTEFFASPKNRQDAYVLAYQRVPLVTDWSTPPSASRSPPQIARAVEISAPPRAIKPPSLDNSGMIRLEQSILPEGAHTSLTHSTSLNIVSGIRFEPKRQSIKFNLALTLSTGEILEGSQDILLQLRATRKRTRQQQPTEASDMNPRKRKQPNILPTVLEPEEAKTKSDRKTLRKRPRKTESSAADEAYEAPDIRRSGRRRAQQVNCAET